MNQNSRYPIRTYTDLQGEQLLQKRTRSQLITPKNMNGGIDKMNTSIYNAHENLPQNIKKQRNESYESQTQQMNNIENSQAQHYEQQHNHDIYLANQRLLQKTNPRLAQSKSKCKSKQTMKMNERPNYVSNQNISPNIAPTQNFGAPPMTNYGVLPPQVNPAVQPQNQWMIIQPPAPQVNTMQPNPQMNQYAPQMPQAASYGYGQVNAYQQQIAGMQNQIAHLSRLSQMQAQMQQLQQQTQFYQPQQPNVQYPQMMQYPQMPQQQMDQFASEQMDRQSLQSLRGSNVHSIQNSPQKKQSAKPKNQASNQKVHQSPHKQSSPPKNVGQNISEQKKSKNQSQVKAPQPIVNSQKAPLKKQDKQDFIPEVSKKMTRSQVKQGPTKIAGNSKTQDTAPQQTNQKKQSKLDSPNKPQNNLQQNLKTKISKSPFKKDTSQIKSKGPQNQIKPPAQAQPIVSLGARRSTRLQQDKAVVEDKQPPILKQSVNESKKSPQKPEVNITSQRRLRNSQREISYKESISGESSENFIPAKNTRSMQRQQQVQQQQAVAVEEVPEAEVTTKPVENEQIVSKVAEEPDKFGSKLLQNMQKDLKKLKQSQSNMQALQERKKKRASNLKRSSPVVDKAMVSETITKVNEPLDEPVMPRKKTREECVLFGETYVEDEEENPLIQKKKYEPQTEIVQCKDNLSTDDLKQIKAGASDYHNQQAYTDDEENEDDINLQLQNEKTPTPEEKLPQLLDENKLQDMEILFGMSKNEINEIAEMQKKQHQKFVDSAILFGNGNIIEKLSHQNSTVNSQKLQKVEKEDPIVVAEFESDPKVANDNRTEDERILFGDNPEAADEQEVSQEQQLKEQETDQFEIQEDSEMNGHRQKQEQQQDEEEEDGEEQPQIIDDAAANLVDQLKANALQHGQQLGEDETLEEVSEFSKDAEEDQQRQDQHQEDDVDADSEEYQQQKLELEQTGDYEQQSLELKKKIAEIEKQIQESENIYKQQLEQKHFKEQDIAVAKEVNEDMTEEEEEEAQGDSEAMQEEEAQHTEEEEDDEHQMIIDQQQEQEAQAPAQVQQPTVEAVKEEVVAPTPVINVVDKEPPESLFISEPYMLLLKFQGSIDQNLNFMYMRYQTQTFSSLKKMVELTARRQFTLTHMKQILTVCPDLYIHHWEMKFGQMELFIQIPSNIEEVLDGKAQPNNIAYDGIITSSVVAKRNKIFKQELQKRAIKGFEIIKSVNAKYANFDVYRQKRFPHDLGLDTICPEIELFELKEQPKQGPVQTMNNFLEKHDTKNQVQKVLEEAEKKDETMRKESNNEAQAQDEDKEEDSELSDTSEEQQRLREKESKQTGISQATYDAIKYKQKVEAEAKMKNEQFLQQQEAKKNIEILVKLADQVKQLFGMHIGSSIYVSRLIQSLLDGQRGTFSSKDTLQKQVIKLTKILPNWISLKQHPTGTMVQLHKYSNIQTPDIKQQIIQYFENQKNNTIHKQGEDQQRLSKSLPPPNKSKEETPISDKANSAQDFRKQSPQPGNSAFQPYRKSKSVAPGEVSNSCQSPKQETRPQQQQTQPKQFARPAPNPRPQPEQKPQPKAYQPRDIVQRQIQANTGGTNLTFTQSPQQPAPPQKTNPQTSQINPQNMSNISSSGTFMSGSALSGNQQNALMNNESQASQKPPSQFSQQRKQAEGQESVKVNPYGRNDVVAKQAKVAPQVRQEQKNIAPADNKYDSMLTSKAAPADYMIQNHKEPEMSSAIDNTNPSKYISPLKDQQNFHQQMQVSENQSSSGFANIMASIGQNQQAQQDGRLCNQQQGSPIQAPGLGGGLANFGRMNNPVGGLGGMAREDSRGLGNLEREDSRGLGNLGALQFGNDLYQGLDSSNYSNRGARGADQFGRGSFAAMNQYNNGRKNSNERSNGMQQFMDYRHTLYPR